MEGKLLSVEQVAEYLGVSKASVYRAVKHGGLPFVRFGSELLRFRPADLEAWIETRRGVSA